MQFKNIAAILLGITATGAIANPIAQPEAGAAIEARAEQGEQAKQAEQGEQGKQSEQGNYGGGYRPNRYDPDDYDEDFYQRGRYQPNDYGRRPYYQDPRFFQGGGQRFGQRYGNTPYDRNYDNTNYREQYRNNRYGGGYRPQGWDPRYGGGFQGCPKLSCFAPNGCNGQSGHCTGGQFASCPCYGRRY